MASDSRGAAVALDVGIAAAPATQREFDFSDADFRSLAQLAYEQAGIALADSKRNLVYSRLSRRLRALGLTSFRQYRDYLDGRRRPRDREASSTRSRPTSPSSSAKRIISIISARTSPVPSCMRPTAPAAAGCESGPPAARPARSPTRSRVVLKREIADIARHDVRILATDIDTEVLAKGARGEYPASCARRGPQEPTSPIFTAGRTTTPRARRIVMSDEVRSLITFRRLNLMERGRSGDSSTPSSAAT